MHKYRVIISADAYLPDLTEGGVSSAVANTHILKDVAAMSQEAKTMDIVQVSIIPADQFGQTEALDENP